MKEWLDTSWVRRATWTDSGAQEEEATKQMAGPTWVSGLELRRAGRSQTKHELPHSLLSADGGESAASIRSGGITKQTLLILILWKERPSRSSRIV